MTDRMKEIVELIKNTPEAYDKAIKNYEVIFSLIMFADRSEEYIDGISYEEAEEAGEYIFNNM